MPVICEIIMALKRKKKCELCPAKYHNKKFCLLMQPESVPAESDYPHPRRKLPGPPAKKEMFFDSPKSWRLCLGPAYFMSEIGKIATIGLQMGSGQFHGEQNKLAPRKEHQLMKKC